MRDLGWRVFTVWECELKAARKDETVKALALSIKAIGMASRDEDK